MNILLGQILKELLIPECIVVETNVQVGLERPLRVMEIKPDGSSAVEELHVDPFSIDIVLYGLEKEKWTDDQKMVLPDGFREKYFTYIFLDFKYDEKLKKSHVKDMLLKRHLFCKNFEYEYNEILYCLLTNRKTNDFIEKMEFYPLKDGVYASDNFMIETIHLIVLDELENTPWNMPFKYFASDNGEKELILTALRKSGVKCV